MKRKITKTVIFSWTILSFLIDLYLAITSKTISSGFGLIAMALGVLTCWFAYKMLIGKRWGLIIMTIFYGLRSFNIHTDNFSFYTRSGLNLEIGMGTAVSLNIITLIFFILLISELIRKPNASR